MNILFFLTPKNSVAFLYSDFTVRQALEVMERYRYASIPIIDRGGAYVGTLTEGDILWYAKKNCFFNMKETETHPLMEVPRRNDLKPVYGDTKVEDLVLNAMNQNFIPVVDDRGIFIGIITRSRILQYLYDRHLKQQPLIAEAVGQSL